jgi:uncharacterized membrane protein HdeD (DUF308 family)
MPKPRLVTEPILVTEMWNHIFWSYTMGGVTALLGLFLIAYPVVTASLTTMVFGVVLIFVSIAQLIFAVHSQVVGGLLLKVVRSALFGMIGVWLVYSPLVGAETLAGLLVAMLLAGAGLEAVMALELRPHREWRWILADALVSFLIGVMILSGQPASSVRGMGILVGIAVLVSGICRIKLVYRMQRRFPLERQYRRAA